MEAGRRLESIDQFRGFAIILMVAANYLAGVESIPTWLKHAPGRFKSEGWRKMAVHFSKRGLALIGMGALITAGGNYFGITPLPANWGVLQLIVLVVVLSVIGWFFDRKNWIFSL